MDLVFDSSGATDCSEVGLLLESEAEEGLLSLVVFLPDG